MSVRRVAPGADGSFAVAERRRNLAALQAQRAARIAGLGCGAAATLETLFPRLGLAAHTAASTALDGLAGQVWE
jgi:hypothetical protein